MNAPVANILLAHGSRDPQWKTPFVEMANTIKQQGASSGSELIIELAYMELCEPSLESVCEQFAKDGFKLINIYPVFFAAGRHLRIDVPKQLANLEAELNIQTVLHPPVGQEKAVQNAITQVIFDRL
jgi:sirohydrochlorin cobaltochelatase